MPYIDIDIEPYEFVRACNKSDIKELIKELVDDGHLPQALYNEKGEVKKSIKPTGYGEREFEEKLDKLKSKYYSLTNEEEEYFEKVFSRLL
jgi:DNA-binding MarR family transcriptional regulator